MTITHRLSRWLTLLLLAGLALPLSAPLTHATGDEDTLRQLEDTVIPPRDRVDLAERVLGVTDIPAPPASAPELQVGDVLTFSADNLDEDYQFQIDARLVYATAHIYMFFEQGYEPDLDAVQRSANTFEETIRPKVNEVFGSEWLPGIDGDPHLYILHARNLGSWVAAYYGSGSEYPTEAVAGSNEHEMFFVNLDTMDWAIGTPYYEGVLAHEFQHMVHWNVDSNEDTWLNEGLSELAAMIAGYGASDFTPDFLAAPSFQLNTWPEDDDRGLHYGAAFAFLAYFYERYGEEATTTLVSEAKNGLESVEQALVAIGATDPATGEPVTLVDLFADWLATNLIQDASVSDGRYAYTFSEMMSLPKATITETLAPGTEPVESAAPQWGPDYLALPASSTPQTFHFTFDGSEEVSLVPATAHSGEMMWWSNRGDESDSRLTRAFDLTGVDSATLNYWTWYWIEEGWDFGYVMVSTDGGATWTPLDTPLTTTDDPHGNSYGPGYTGQSGDWVQESLDLTPYAGQAILVRFEYITDDAVTQPGLIIDDVSVPEIEYSEDFESGDGGWTSEGWILMNNRLPQTFLVEVVAPGAETPVTRLLGPQDGTQGEWDIPVSGEGDTVIVIAGLAPVTTEPAAYTYTLSAAG